MTSQLSLAIVTKKRTKQLNRCLRSLRRQDELPRRIFIVDNDPDRSAEKIAVQFERWLPITYFVEQKQGIPQARNLALKACKTALLAFIDDDCVVDKHWIRIGRETASNSSYKTAYIVGKNLILNPKNTIAQTQFYINNFWFQCKMVNKTEKLNPQCLDTKNVILKLKILKKHNLIFDQRFSNHKFGGWADTDLGLQLNSHGFNGYYQPKMIIYHEEVDNLAKFTCKAYSRGKTAFLLHDKWDLRDELVDINELRLKRWISHMRTMPSEVKRLKGKNLVKRIIITLLKRIYERIHLQGFIDQKRKLDSSTLSAASLE